MNSRLWAIPKPINTCHLGALYHWKALCRWCICSRANKYFPSKTHTQDLINIYSENWWKFHLFRYTNVKKTNIELLKFKVNRVWKLCIVYLDLRRVDLIEIILRSIEACLQFICGVNLCYFEKVLIFYLIFYPARFVFAHSFLRKLCWFHRALFFISQLRYVSDFDMQ